MTAIEQLRNLGPKTAARLRVVGVHSDEDLMSVGAAVAFQRMCDAGFRPSKLALWALHGAVLDIDWREIPAAEKRQLLKEVERLEAED